jgi:DNA-binding transcriptional MerR regulator
VSLVSDPLPLPSRGAERRAPIDSFSSKRVCELTGLTYRQLTYWDTTGLLRPSVARARGSGTAKRYSGGDLAKARVIKHLLDVGISLQSVRRALPMVGEAQAEGLRWLVVSNGGAAVACTDEPVELARVVAEARVAVVIDLQEPP